MSDQISLLRAAAHPDNTDGVTATTPTMRYRPEKCEFPIHIGLFFDGTRNNQDWADPALGGATQLARKKDSNVARLFRAYPGVLQHLLPRFLCRLHAIRRVRRDQLDGMAKRASGRRRIFAVSNSIRG